MQPTRTDTELVAAARGGDRDCFAVLLQRHWPLLVALCHRTLGDAGLVADAAQETALQAMLNLDRLQAPDRFGAWLAGIGLNICRRLQNERARDYWSWEAQVGGLHVLSRPDPDPGPEEIVETAELRVWVRTAVAGLPPGQRAAVLLFYLSGLTHAETAAHLGITIGAVKTRLHKARDTLKQQLWAIVKEERQMTTIEASPVPVRIAGIRRPPTKDDSPRLCIVRLEESHGPRHLDIYIGAPEGTGLALLVEDVQTLRPMTVVFMAEVLKASGARLTGVTINKLIDDVFYAIASIEGPAGTKRIDTRPSDALGLALATRAPVSVMPEVFDKASEYPSTRPGWAGTDKDYDSSTEGSAEMVTEWLAVRAAPAPPTSPGS